MDLTVLERLILLGLLPREGDITTLRIVRELREGLSFTEDEHDRLQFKNAEGERLTWRDDGTVKTVEIGAKATALIVGKLDEMNTEGKLTEQHIGLCEKFGIG